MYKMTKRARGPK